MRPASFPKVSKIAELPRPDLERIPFQGRFFIQREGLSWLQKCFGSSLLAWTCFERDPNASIELPSCVGSVPTDWHRHLLTIVSKLLIAYGVVRVSARVVGILLHSCSQRQNSNDLQLGLQVLVQDFLCGYRAKRSLPVRSMHLRCGLVFGYLTVRSEQARTAVR